LKSEPTILTDTVPPWKECTL